MPSSPSSAAYDSIADWYAGWVEHESWAHPTFLRHLFALTGDVSGSCILDVGCGEGYFSRAIARAGAQVTGIDISERMLSLARSRTNADLPVTYVIDDAQALNEVRDRRFDGAICILALMDIPDLAATFRAIRHAVNEQGWFVIGITHPCFDGPHASRSDDDRGNQRIITAYLSEGHWVSSYAPGIRGRVGACHRTISTYLNTARESGWELESMLEPANLTHEGDVAPQGPDIPRMLLARFRVRIP
jgi:SAM-dependent methyltransferase